MLAVMSRAKRRPKDAGAERHTAGSLEAIAEELELLATSLRVSATRLKANHVSYAIVPFQNSLDVGLPKLHTWTDAAKQAVGEAIREAAKDVSENDDSVSDSDQN